MLLVKLKKNLSVDREGRAADFNPAAGTRAREPFALDVEFDAPPGFTILFGASGAGKSLTLRMIAGLSRPDAGRIVSGETVLFDSERGVDLPARVRGAGYAFQSPALLPHLTALGNVEFALAGLGRAERRRRALELLADFRVEHVAGRRPREISGGEAQRVSLARALARGPRFLLLDEPLSALDEPVKLSIIEDLRRLERELNLPVVYVTHSREEAVALGARVVIYERGRVVATGEPLEVFGVPRTSAVARLTGVDNLFAARVVSRDETAGTMKVLLLSDKDGDESAGGGADAGARGGEEGNGPRLEVPLAREAGRGEVTVAVRSGDVLVATVEPRGTSARNVFGGRVVALEARHASVVARVDCGGVVWAASLTRRSVEELRLEVGGRVWLAVKTHSCHLLNDGP